MVGGSAVSCTAGGSTSAIGAAINCLARAMLVLYVKGFGCRPEHELSIRYEAGVRKPWKKEPAGKR